MIQNTGYAIAAAAEADNRHSYSASINLTMKRFINSFRTKPRNVRMAEALKSQNC